MIRIALRALLAERGMTQLELAQKAVIRPSTICEVLEVQVSDVIKKQA